MERDAVHVAVAVIPDGEQRTLWTWNQAWGEFALPMTKLRGGPAGLEAPERAALRAGAEALGVPVLLLPGTLRLPLSRASFSGRRRATGNYVYHIIAIEPHADFAGRLNPRTPLLWLTASAALEGDYEPLSASSRDILDRVLLVIPPGPPLRRSRAALAVICRQDAKDQPRWLAQWNSHWNRFHFVGGHKRREETFRDCLRREVADELSLNDGTDFTVDEQPLAHEEYIARSERYQQDTKYEMELYRVQLRGSTALARVSGDLFNRWLTAAEIRAGRCADGQLISETMLLLLDRTGWPGA